MRGASNTYIHSVLSEMNSQQNMNKATPHNHPNQIAICLLGSRRRHI